MRKIITVIIIIIIIRRRRRRRKTHALSLPTHDMIHWSYQMRKKLLQRSSRSSHYSYIHHCSSFTSITLIILHALHTFLFYSTLFSHCPSILFLVFLSQRYIYYIGTSIMLIMIIITMMMILLLLIIIMIGVGAIKNNTTYEKNMSKI